ERQSDRRQSVRGYRRAAKEDRRASRSARDRAGGLRPREMSQFAFLQAEFSEIFGHAARAETLANADPRAAAFYCRLALETAVGWLYRHDGTLKDPYDPTLAALLAEPSFQALVGRTLAVKARFVKDTGNAAAHGKPVSAAQAAGTLREFFHVA